MTVADVVDAAVAAAIFLFHSRTSIVHSWSRLWSRCCLIGGKFCPLVMSFTFCRSMFVAATVLRVKYE